MRIRTVSRRYLVRTSRSLLVNDPYGPVWPRFRLTRPEWRPPLDLWATDKHLLITLELGGVRKDDLEVIVYEDAIVVRGIRKPPAPRGAQCYLAEIRSGPFRAEVALPPGVLPDAAEHHFENGLLQIRLPKEVARD